MSRRLFDVECCTGMIWDPACGLGRICEAAQAAGYHTVGTDLVDRGFGGKADFLTSAAPMVKPFSVVANPPFKLARDFVLRALDLGAAKVPIVFPVRCLNAAHWLQPLPLATTRLLTPQPSIPPGHMALRLQAQGREPSGGTVDFCWLVFDRKDQGPPVVRWLHRDGGRT